MRWCDACQYFVPRQDGVCDLCGADHSASATLVDERFRLGKQLGSGGMGNVYHATDVTLGRPAAVKFLHVVPGPGQIDRVQQFRREAIALAAVRSDHVARLYSFGLHELQPFFAMEFVSGVALAKLLRDEPREPIAPLRALALTRRIAQGLSAVHATGVVHCDVKPSNIVIEDGTGRPVLVDFGIAQLSGNLNQDAIELSGTPGYMAPEQVVPEHPILPATDVYALGCSLFEMLTGRLPFQSSTVVRMMMMHVNDDPPAPSSVDPALEPLDAVVLRALEKSPTKRYATAHAFAHAIESVMPAFERVRPGVADAAATAPVGLRALVIDDDPMLAKLAAKAIESAFRSVEILVDIANSGDEALARWQSAPDLVILDLHMPGRDGTETLAVLRERKRGQQMRALAWTARPLPEFVRKFRALGVEQVLQKPLTFQRLVSELRAVGQRSGWILPETEVTLSPRPRA